MKILIVDDEPALLNQLQNALERNRYQVETALDGENALDRIFASAHDLILLDIMLPGLDGLSLLKQIREARINTPVLMLTARSDVKDRVQGLDFGADDYLAKPFSMAELLARVRALLRRGSDRDAILSAGNIRLDTISRKVTRGDQEISLTAKEFSLLEFLLYNKGSAVSRFNLAEHVWGDSFDPFSMSNFIDVHIKNLRRKIKKPDNTSIIRTIRGIGFIIDGES
jgi:DNA-binding response OmpR family regulator